MIENMSTIDFGDKLFEFKDNLISSKKYWIIYLALIIIVSLSMFELKNFAHPEMELAVIFLTSIFGIFIIAFYYGHNNQKDLYKTAFIIIFLFGLLICFLNPICNVSDEGEHLARADITSQGIMFPEYVNNSFMVSDSIAHFYQNSRSLSVLQVDGDTDKINSTLTNHESVFQHNPFFGYFPQALGLLIAKILDLNVIWLLWLGRIGNLLFYSLIVSYAVKKSPMFKVPIIAMACIPVCMQQAASVSIDGVFAALGILTVSYFFYLFKHDNYSIDNKKILKFSILCLILGLCKLPFLALILLLFCIPSYKFKSNNSTFYIILGIIVVFIIGMLWSKYWAMPNYIHSWRAFYYSQHHVNSSQQIQYMISHPLETLITIFHLPNSLGDNPVLTAFSSIYSAIPGKPVFYDSGFISAIIPLFIGAIWFLYPNTDEIDMRSRIFTLIVLVIVYIGVCFSQIISWGAIGNLGDLVIHTRYFFPLLSLVPFIFGINKVKTRNYNVDIYIICLSILFAASLVIKLTMIYY